MPSRLPVLALVVVLLLGAWPHLYVLPLQPVLRDEVAWMVRSAHTDPNWTEWVFRSDHFVAYRPVTALTYTADSLLGGLDPRVYHATDLALHLGAALALWALVRRWCPGSPWSGVVAAGALLLHPVSGQVVPFLARRAYPLAAIGALLGLWLLGPLDRRPSVRQAWSAGIVFALAGLANEAGYAAVGVGLLALASSRPPARDAAVRGVALLAPSLVAIAVRSAVLGDAGGYAVDAGSRWSEILSGSVRGLFGLAQWRSDTAAPSDLVGWVVALGLVGALIYATMRPTVAKAGALAGAWIAVLLVLYLPQGVFFPRQVYLLAVPLALWIAVAIERARLGPALAAIAVLAWTSPVIRGPDPAHRATWTRTDAWLRDAARDLADAPADKKIFAVIPAYLRPDKESVRAREERRETWSSRHMFNWLDATAGVRLQRALFLLADPLVPGPVASLLEDERRVRLAPGVEVIDPNGEPVPTNDLFELRSAAGGRAHREDVLYFHDGTKGAVLRVGSRFTSRYDPRYPEPPVFADGPVVRFAADDHDGTFGPAGWQANRPDGTNVADGTNVVRLGFDALPAAISARLHLPVVGPFEPLELQIRAVVDGRPSEKSVAWTVSEPWLDPYGRPELRARQAPPECAPLARTSPDLAPLLDAAGPRTFEIRALRGTLRIADAAQIDDEECTGSLAARLEVYPSVRSAFSGQELLVRPGSSEVSLALRAEIDAEVQVDVEGPDGRVKSTPIHSARAGEALVIRLDGLRPATEYRYTVRARRAGARAWERWPTRRFHTARAAGEPLVFTVTADAHLLNLEHRRAYASMHLMQSTFARIGREHPDLHVDLGDSFNGESYRSFDATDAEEALRRHLAIRPFYEQVGAPALFVLGNHEGEQGWRVQAADPLPALAEDARRVLFPAPPSPDPHGGYWSVAWGDVLLVAVDPYRNTVRKPHDVDGTEGSGDRWDWTLGEAQYRWLVETLQESTARYKLVLTHQLTGGTNDYGRGGKVAARGYEWGDGGAYPTHRPGWAEPVQDVLARTGVTAVVRGHDHVFAFEPPLDGVAYVACPQPGDAQYDQGHGTRSELDPEAVVIENSGYLRFSVRADGLHLDYVRTYLPGEGPDGEVAFSHVFR